MDILNIIFMVFIILVLIIYLSLNLINLTTYPDEISTSCGGDPDCGDDTGSCFFCDGGIFNRRW